MVKTKNNTGSAPIFSKAIVRTPCKNMVNGLTTAGLGTPDYDLALEQHAAYIAALQSCGLEVHILDADEAFPDSTFVEDTAVLAPGFAVICYPGAASRRDEIWEVRNVLSGYFEQINSIKFPGTLDGGDVMLCGGHFYVGLSSRSNAQGFERFKKIVQHYGMKCSAISMDKGLHLKSDLAYLESESLLAGSEYSGRMEFRDYKILQVDANEARAANCLWINHRVLVPAGYPKTAAVVEKAGYSTITIDVSEFAKLDGGLSCLSLRF